MFRRDQVAAIYRPLISATVRRLKATLPRSIDEQDLKQTGEEVLLCVADRLENYLITRLRGGMLDSVRAQPRAHQAIPIDGLPVDELHQFSTPHPSLVEEIDANRRETRVAVAILSLPAPERKVIAMKLSGATFPEIALGVKASRRTVIRRHGSAIQILRSSLAAKAA
jgi:DNA-directed RNA polymerase specialized sigma subunit